MVDVLWFKAFYELFVGCAFVDVVHTQVYDDIETNLNLKIQIANGVLEPFIK
jgi:hypothetical protein